jgi:uroporphyrinogen decarboxylase
MMRREVGPMAKHLTKRERLSRSIAGPGAPGVDRLPVALWRHFFVEETSRAGLVEAMVRWQKTFDWDFLKINPRACYHVQDWGNQYEFSGSEHVKPTLVRSAVHTADDFRHLDLLDATGGGEGLAAPVLADHLGAVGDLRKALGPDVPMLMTIFTPMSIAADLAGGPQDLAGLVREDATMVHVGLRTITDTFARFARQCIEAGADGIFLATTHSATTTNFTPEQYEEFGRPYDLEILDAAEGAPLNLLHVCKSHAMVRLLADYPAAMLNWDMRDKTNPRMNAIAPLAPDKALVGGLDRFLFPRKGACGTLLAQIEETRREMGDRPFVVGSTCTIETTSDPEAVMAVREAVEK